MSFLDKMSDTGDKGDKTAQKSHQDQQHNVVERKEVKDR